MLWLHDLIRTDVGHGQGKAVQGAEKDEIVIHIQSKPLGRTFFGFCCRLLCEREKGNLLRLYAGFERLVYHVQ